MGMQSASAFSAGKALKRESNSIQNNLNKSNQLNEKAELYRNRLQHHKSNMMDEGITIQDDVSSRLAQAQAKCNTESLTLRDNHQQITNSSMKTRIQSEAMTQASRLIHKITQGYFGVKAAEQNKNAEIIRVNQTVSSEVDSVHQQTSKKSGEGESALQQALLAILNNNNDAVSAIASKMA